MSHTVVAITACSRKKKQLVISTSHQCTPNFLDKSSQFLYFNLKFLIKPPTTNNAIA